MNLPECLEVITSTKCTKLVAISTSTFVGCIRSFSEMY